MSALRCVCAPLSQHPRLSLNDTLTLLLPSTPQIVQADLTDADSWVAACKGISHVMHVASPAPARVPKDDNELVKPAVEGTRNVLAAAKAAGVRRVVVTSSNSAISAGWDAKAASGYECVVVWLCCVVVW